MLHIGGVSSTRNNYRNSDRALGSAKFFKKTITNEN